MVKPKESVSGRNSVDDIRQEFQKPKNLSSIVASFVPVYGEFHSYLTGKNEWSAYRAAIPAIMRTALMTSFVNFAYGNSTTVSQRAEFTAGYTALALAGNMVIYLTAHPKSLSQLAGECKKEALEMASEFFEKNDTC